MGGWDLYSTSQEQLLRYRSEGLYADTDGIFDKCSCGNRVYLEIIQAGSNKIYQCYCGYCNRHNSMQSSDFTELWEAWNKLMRKGGYAYYVERIIREYPPAQASNILRERFKHIMWMLDGMPNPKKDIEAWNEWANKKKAH